MKIIPLGGAEEIGASSSILDFGKIRVLVDAGIRVGSKGKDALPNFQQIQEEAGDIQAIFITHAHLDHVGALPIIHMAFPKVPIFMTPATFSIMQTLFADSLRIMQKKWESEREIPLYPETSIASCFGAVRPIHFHAPFLVKQGQLSASFHPAGHILGASSIFFESPVGSLLFTGDISITHQRTIPGMAPPRVQPDVVITESTYGGKFHANRPNQEKKLIEMIAETYASQGKVLIPSFAIGRAQEVILILKQAIRDKKLPAMKVFVDGMVRQVCQSYHLFPTYLQKKLQSRKQGENIFFPHDIPIIPIQRNSQRKTVLEQGPCCIVSSSGMLTGGPSAYYAQQLVEDSNNLIAITGYQDEEAPGKELLQLASQTEATRREISIQGTSYKVMCKVQKYGLSAHADSGEITGMMGALAPKHGAILVHGDEQARHSLCTMMQPHIKPEISLPANGEVLSFKGTSRKFLFSQKNRSPKTAISPSGETLQKNNVSFLHQTLWAETRGKGLFSMDSLMQRWYGYQHTPTTKEVEQFQNTIYQHQTLFRKRLHNNDFELVPTQQAKNPKKNTDINQLFETVQKHFPNSTDLYKKGARQTKQELLLYFKFPNKAKHKYQTQIQQLEKETGWKIVVNSTPHHSSLQELLRQLLPDNVELHKNPSLFHETQTMKIVLRFEENPLLHEKLGALQEQFFQETHYTLEYQHHQPQKLQEKQKISEKMEQNRAFAWIDQAFFSLAHQPHRKSKKDDRFVLHFLSPSIGERYKNLLAQLQQETGWKLEIHPEPNQHGIRQEVRLLFSTDWELKKEPSIFLERRVVSVALQKLPTKEEQTILKEKVYEKTGFYLEFAEV